MFIHGGNNEEDYMHINNIIKYIICICAGILMGGCFLYFGRCRNQSQRIEELERTASEQEQQLTRLNDRNIELVNRLQEHSDRARELVTSMGEQLDRDHNTLSTTTELIRALRTQMQNLQDYYNYICSDCNSINGTVNLGV